MHFNIYLDDRLGQRLIEATQTSHKTRNALIREAIDLWLEKHERSSWPDEIIQFEGIEDFPAFETHRHDLKSADKDPFA